MTVLSNLVAKYGASLKLAFIGAIVIGLIGTIITSVKLIKLNGAQEIIITQLEQEQKNTLITLQKVKDNHVAEIAIYKDLASKEQLRNDTKIIYRDIVKKVVVNDNTGCADTVMPTDAIKFLSDRLQPPHHNN